MESQSTSNIGLETPENIVIGQIWKKVHKDKMNQIILVDGLPRTGKSELCCRLAEMLDPTFTVDKIAWKYADFLELIKESKSKGHEVFVWDEAGIADWGANARQFWSEGNLSASTLFQTMGFKENICIINLPMKMMLDKHVRSLIHVNIKTKRVIMRKGVCDAKVYYIVPKDDGKDNKTIYPRHEADGIKFKLKSIYFGRASKELRKAYKVRSEIVKQELQQKLVAEAQIRAEGKAGGRPKPQFNDVYDKVIANPKDYWDEKKKKIDSSLIMAQQNVGRSMAEMVARAVNLMIRQGKIKLSLSP
jgi:hypothetical protein